MSAKIGAGGREVPGAVLIEDGATKAKGNKKKKKGGKRHKKTASIAKTVQSDSTLVDEHLEDEHQTTILPQQHGEPELEPQSQSEVEDAASDATVTESKPQEDEENIDELAGK